MASIPGPLALFCLSTTLVTLQHAYAEPHNYLERFEASRLLIGQEGTRGTDTRLEVNITELRYSGEWVIMQLQGVSDPQPTDLLALFSLPDAYERQAAPVKYENCTASPDYLQTGSASLSFRLINVRQDMGFVLIRGGTDSPQVIAKGPVIRNACYDQPTGIHLMLGKSTHEMLVQWSTRDAGSPTVKYGMEPGVYQYWAPAVTDTYTRDDMCGGPAKWEGWLDPGSLHTATLAGLLPGTRYFYVVGDQDSGVYNPERSFLSHPGVGPEVCVHILAVADQGVGEPDGSLAAMEFQPALEVGNAMIRDAQAGVAGQAGRQDGNYTLVLHNGDISYARGYGALWDTFLFQQAPILETMPMMTAIGNHERDWPGSGDAWVDVMDSGGECGVPYYMRFPMPQDRPDQPWYSFDYGPIHFTYMSTEHAFHPGSPQHAWLAADLGAVNRSLTPWLVFVGHRPIYIDSDDSDNPQGKQATAMQLQQALEDLLLEHQVDLALAGHHHSYGRTCPVAKGVCRYNKRGRPRAPVYVVHGHGGADLYSNQLQPRPAWVEAVDSGRHGHVRLHANGTHLHLEAVDSQDGSVFDELTLTKDPDYLVSLSQGRPTWAANPARSDLT